MLSGQLVQIAVDGGGVGAGALGFEVLEDIGRADRVLAVADEIIYRLRQMPQKREIIPRKIVGYHGS